MELLEEELYATAALFTLALHSCLFEAGNNTETAWGEPAAARRDPDALAHLDEAALDGFWGYDCVVEGGLLDRVYQQLQIPATKWQGLKTLPSGALQNDDESFRLLVRSLIVVLDAELAASLPPLLARRRPLPAAQLEEEGRSPISPEAAQARSVRDDLFDGLLSSSDDEDWAADIARELRLQAVVAKVPTPRASPASAAATAGASPAAATTDASPAAAAPTSAAGGIVPTAGTGDTAEPSTSADEGQEELAAATTPACRKVDPSSILGQLTLEEGAAEAGPSLPPAATPGCMLEVVPSHKALACAWELVQCCVGSPATAYRPAAAAPREGGAGGEGIELSLLGNRGTSSSSGGEPAPLPLPREPAVRWYDARARVALRLVTSWLQLPWRKVANMEVLLTCAKAPSHKGLSSKEEDAWERRLRYLKVGAAAVGGGALFAVTGGLAAPAIAAGLGSVMAVVGTPAAVAGTITGFLSTTGGVAAMTGTMAASGATTFSARMAHRVGNISEFGFLEVQQCQPAPPDQRLGGSRSGSLAKVEEGALSNGTQQQGEEAEEQQAAVSDPGHLTSFGSFSGAARAGSSGSTCGSEGGSGATCSSSGGGQDPLQGGAAAAATTKSAWQRWFGRREEAPLLPVPMRMRASGDIKLSVVIGVSGWITTRDDFVGTWSCLRAPDADCFALVWETKQLLALNSAIGNLVALQAAGQSVRIAAHSFFYAGAGLVAALAPTVLIGTASGLVLNNAWAVAMDRSVKGGKLLAHLLMSGCHGDRPVSLVGHSMGARLIYFALLELERQGCRGVVQDVVLMGTPVGTQPERWAMARRACSGRLLNCYSRRDWVLGVLFGGSSGWMKPAAGLVPIEQVCGVENVNLTPLVQGHFAYIQQLEQLLECIGIFCI